MWGSSFIPPPFLPPMLPKKRLEAHLLDPRGPLSSKMFPSTIAAANTEVIHVMNGHTALPSLSVLEKGNLQQVCARVQGKVARYAIENGSY